MHKRDGKYIKLGIYQRRCRRCDNMYETEHKSSHFYNKCKKKGAKK